MALTNVEENQVRELLTVKEELLDLGADSSNILAEIGGTDTTVPQLTAAVTLTDTDETYLAQGANDRKVTIGQINDYIIDPHEAAADPHPQYLTLAEGDARYAQALGSSWLNRVILTAASGSYTVPAGVKVLRAYAIGKGGNGTAGTASTRSGGGGGGGGCAWGEITVTAGDVIPYTIDASGSVFGTFLTATNGASATSAVVGAGGTGTKSVAVLNGGTASGGTGGLEVTGQQGGSGGGASGSSLGNGGNGANGTSAGGGGGGWGGNGISVGGSFGYGAGTGGNASSDGPSGSGGTWSTTTRSALGRTQFSAYIDPLLAPCTSGLYMGITSSLLFVSGGSGGTGGSNDVPPTYGGGAGGGSTGQARRLDSFFGGGGGGSAVSGFTGGNAGYGGGGGGGAGGASPTAGGTGGAGCIVIFY